MFKFDAPEVTEYNSIIQVKKDKHTVRFITTLINIYYKYRANKN